MNLESWSWEVLLKQSGSIVFPLCFIIFITSTFKQCAVQWPRICKQTNRAWPHTLISFFKALVLEFKTVTSNQSPARETIYVQKKERKKIYTPPLWGLNSYIRIGAQRTLIHWSDLVNMEKCLFLILILTPGKVWLPLFTVVEYSRKTVK